jgi:hypothetical protein
VALGSNPVGWAAVGIAAAGVAVSVGATNLFNLAYENNFLGVQDGLDWAGQQIDKGLDWASDQLSNAGEAINSGLDFINPFS